MLKVTWIHEGKMVVSAVDYRDLFKFGLENAIVMVESFS